MDNNNNRSRHRNHHARIRSLVGKNPHHQDHCNHHVDIHLSNTRPPDSNNCNNICNNSNNNSYNNHNNYHTRNRRTGLVGDRTRYCNLDRISFSSGNNIRSSCNNCSMIANNNNNRTLIINNFLI